MRYWAQLNSFFIRQCCSFALKKCLDIIVASIVFMAAVNGYSFDLVLRNDINQELSAFVCSQTGEIGAQQAFSNAIFDAHLQAVIVQAKSISISELDRSARALAKRHHQLGYSFGQCLDGHYWLASMPASAAVQLQVNHAVLPSDQLSKHCSSTKIIYAPWDGLKTKQLEMSAYGHLNLSKLAPGSIAVVCQPSQPRWLGPVSWYLFPVGKINFEQIPFVSQLASQSAHDFSARLQGWVNRIRSHFGLKHLTMLDQGKPQSLVNLLAASGRLLHDRDLLKELGARLKRHGIEALGENRVRAASLKEAAQLLWASPPHRQLLLHPRANVLMMSTHSLASDQLTVMVLGFRASATVSLKIVPPQRQGENSRQ